MGCVLYDGVKVCVDKEIKRRFFFGIFRILVCFKFVLGDGDKL